MRRGCSHAPLPAGAGLHFLHVQCFYSRVVKQRGKFGVEEVEEVENLFYTASTPKCFNWGGGGGNLSRGGGALLGSCVERSETVALCPAALLHLSPQPGTLQNSLQLHNVLPPTPPPTPLTLGGGGGRDGVFLGKQPLSLHSQRVCGHG